MSTLIDSGIQTELPKHLQEHLERLAHTSFMLPEASRKAMELAKDPNCEVEDFLVVIQRDPKLAADILAMANSAAFGPKSKIGSLQQAVVRLGFRQCRNLILAAAFASLMSDWPAKQQLMRNGLWRHSFATAVLCQQLNRKFKLKFEGEEFTSGLIHDFGRFALALCFSELCQHQGARPGQETETILETETAIAGANHCQVGAYVVRINGLPSFLADTVLFHHTPDKCPPANRKLCSLVAVSDHIARHLFSKNTGEGYLPDSNPFLTVLESTGVVDATILFSEMCAPLLEEIMEVLKSDPFSRI